MKNSESIQLVKEQLQIKSVELRKVAENNTTINNKIRTLITENQDEVKKLKTTISKKDEEIQQREKIIRTTSDQLKQVQESAKEQIPSQVIDPKIIEKIKALKVHTDKLNKKIKSEQEFNKKFEKEKSILLKEVKRLKKDEGKTDELFKRVEQYKKKLTDAENSTNEVDESLQKLIKEKDILIKKLTVTISKSNKDVGIPEELLKNERFEGMKPVEIMLALKEDVAKMEKDRKKVKKRFEALKEDNETLEMKLNAAVADSEGG